jgi:Ca2+-binding EF-hand superfamily protein
MGAKDNLLTAEQAYAVLADKFSSRFATVRKAFLLNKGAGHGDGYIGRNEFRESLERINVKMTGEEFRKLWKTFDSSGDGKISYAEFNNQIGPMVAPPSMGLQMKRPETPKMKEWQRKSMATRIRQKVKDIEQTFHDIDTDGSGRISHAEFIQALRKMGVRGVGDTESWQMMTKYRRPANDSGEMLFEEFKDCMLDYLRIPDTLPGEEAPPAELVEVLSTLRSYSSRNRKALAEACAKYDPQERGEMDYGQLRTVFEALGLRVSKEHFTAICHKYDPTDDGAIFYRELCADVGSTTEEESETPDVVYTNLADFNLQVSFLAVLFCVCVCTHPRF